MRLAATAMRRRFRQAARSQTRRSLAPVRSFYTAPRRRREGRGGTGRTGQTGGAMIFPRRAGRPQQRRRTVSLWRAAARTVCMCPEQAADLMAAQSGGITWAQYFRKWGPSL
jgi:hypothetical protein